MDKDPMREMIEGLLKAEATAKELLSDYERTFPDASGRRSEPAEAGGWLTLIVQEPDRILYRLIWAAWITAWYVVFTVLALGVTAGGTLVLAYFGQVLDELTHLPFGRFAALGVGGLVGIYEITYLAREYRASLNNSPWE